MNILDRYSYKNLKKKAHEANFDMKLSYLISLVVLVCVLVAVMSIMYRINIFLWILLELFAISMMPVIVYYYLYQRRENIRFNEVDIYVHQMAYSFLRSPKIITALKDATYVLDGNFRRLIDKAVNELETGQSENVYEAALQIIEKEYKCIQITSLHRFLINIEKRGGNYYNSLDVLIEDFDRWVKRIYSYQKSIRMIKRNTFIGILLSCILASVSVMISLILDNTSGISMNIADEALYQAASVIFVLANFIFFIFVQIKYSINWLNIARSEANVMKDYKLAFGGQSKSVKLFSAGVAASVITASLAVAASGNYVMVVVMFLVGIYLLAVPQLNKNSAKKRVKEDVYISFSEWLRDIVILLQDEPLQAAIVESYETCPPLLKKSLSEFIYNLEENPSDVRAYYQYMSEFEVLDISSTVKTLYSISESDTGDMERLVNTLIKRNYELVDKHEELNNADNISAMRMGEYIPMLFVSLKIAVDMLLVITNYL